MKKRPVGGNSEIRRLLARHRVLEDRRPQKPFFRQLLFSLLLYVLLPLGTAWLVSAAVNSHNQYTLDGTSNHAGKQREALSTDRATIGNNRYFESITEER